MVLLDKLNISGLRSMFPGYASVRAPFPIFLLFNLQYVKCDMTLDYYQFTTMKGIHKRQSLYYKVSALLK